MTRTDETSGQPVRQPEADPFHPITVKLQPRPTPPMDRPCHNPFALESNLISNFLEGERIEFTQGRQRVKAVAADIPSLRRCHL